jgi:hypothetical protein
MQLNLARDMARFPAYKEKGDAEIWHPPSLVRLVSLKTHDLRAQTVVGCTDIFDDIVHGMDKA